MIRLFASHPTAAFLLALLLAAAGLVAAPGLRRDTFPDYRADRIEIRLAYPGAAPEEVEEAICLRLEEALEGIAGIDELTCTARRNVAVALVRAIHGHDTSRLLTELKTAIDSIERLPPTVERPVVRQLDITEPVVALALSAPVPPAELRVLADQMKARLLRVPGVAEVAIHGFSERRLEVALDGARLRALGLSAAAVAATLERQSLDLPAGTVETAERDMLLRFVDRRRTAAELEAVVLRDLPGGAVRLGDIAVITEGFVEEEVRTSFDGARAALLQVRRDRGDDALRVLAAVEAFAVAERRRMPDGVRLDLTSDSVSLIADRLGMLVVNAAQGLVLVCLVLWAFFPLRFALAVAAALPLSLLASLFVMQAIGQSLNLISMVGLLIAIGLLIDSAIVVNENIARQVRRGAGPVEAAVQGVREVADGVVSSFLTSVAVFAPLAFLAGDIGRVLGVVPAVLIIALAASLVVSFLVLPFFAARTAGDGSARGRLRHAIDRGFDALRDRLLGGLLRRAIAWWPLTLGLTGLAFLASLSLLAGGAVKFQAFPDMEGDVVEARLMLAPGTPRARTEAAVETIVAALGRVEARLGTAERPLVRHILVEMARNPDVADQGAHRGEMRADLLGGEARGVRVERILAAWRAEVGLLPDLVSLTFREPAIGPAGAPIEIRLSGDDPVALRAAADDLLAALARYDGVTDLVADLHPGGEEIRLALREGAGRLGLDAATVARQLRAALQGHTADEVQAGRSTLRIDLRHGAAWRGGAGDIEDLVVTLADGRMVPLPAVATLEPGRGLASIARVDGRRTVTIRGEVMTERTNANEVLAALRHSFGPRLADRHPGIAMRFEGQAAAQAETAGSVRRAFAIGVLGMFLVLSFQFRSFAEPLIVMAAIPLSLVGVIGGHWLMGLELSMPSMVGFVSLAGIVVNNSILLVLAARSRMAEGCGAAAAVEGAAVERFRAIFLTSATTIAGLVPLLFETSLQAQVLIPLVAALAFGLLAATVLVLLVIPALYVLLERTRSGSAGRADAASLT